MQFKNVSPLGDLFLPALGREVKFGEVFEVPADVAEGFTAQPSNWQSVKAKESN